MTIADMVSVLNAKVLIGADKLDTPVYTACCSDLMSDVLAFVDEKTVLITGLTNPHVVRTLTLNNPAQRVGYEESPSICVPEGRALKTNIVLLCFFTFT